MDVIEILKFSTYSFNLYANGMVSNSLTFQLTLPACLSANSGTCETTGSGTCTVVSPTVKNITGILSSMANSGDLIQFNYTFITNPSRTYLFADVHIEVSFIAAGGITFYYGSFPISHSTSNKYEAHRFTGATIDPSSQGTATNCTYTINFVNSGYSIPQESKIKIEVPATITELSNSPGLNTDDLINISTGASLSYATYPYIVIENPFSSDLPAYSNVRFAINLLNPYKTGVTDTFKIFVSVTEEGVEYSSFACLESLNITIDTISSFLSPSLTISDLTTDQDAYYLFELTLRAGGINTSHNFELSQSSSNQVDCNHNMFESKSTSLIINNRYVDANNVHREYFSLSSTIEGDTTISFNIECRNPYTTSPPNDIKVRAKEFNDEFVFYQSNVSIPSMTNLNTFQSCVVNLGNLYPRALNTFKFDVATISSQPTQAVNQLVINLGILEVATACAITASTGFTGTLSCVTTNDNKTVIVEGFTELSNVFNITLGNIRNPSVSTDTINMELYTRYSDANQYNAKKQILAPKSVPCNFPCKTCNANPEECISCFPSGDEVFTVDGESYFRYYSVGNQCLTECTSNMYPTTPPDGCHDCSANCLECSLASTTCTKCYTDTYLHETQCISTDCPDGYLNNDATWNCDRNIIYIYIYIASFIYI